MKVRDPVWLILLLSTAGIFGISGDTLGLQMPIPLGYTNHAQHGSYINPTWVGEVPEWNYYDIFGNHLLEGFYLYGMSLYGSKEGESAVSLHPFLKKWLNGMVQVGDLADDRGILFMIGDRVKSQFTPYTFNQSLYCGIRADAFFDFFHGMNGISLITSRISNTGFYGMFADHAVTTLDADWLHGVHVVKEINDIAGIGVTLMNMHLQAEGKPNTFRGALGDSMPASTPSALSILGVDGRCNFETPKLTAYGEFAQCQERLGGSFKPPAGHVATLNFKWDIFDKLKFGGEGYLVQSSYKTSFSPTADLRGDRFGSGKYLYSLIEDNDDGDDYPENGQSKLTAVPFGDPDGTLPAKYDKDKNGKFDFEEDFLNYDADPPTSQLYFDRNNNGIPDEIEDDQYPDYTYVPSYYLPGERYLRYNDMTQQWKEEVSDGQVSKGITGYHSNVNYQIHPDLNVGFGGIYEESEKKSFQMRYEDTAKVGFTLVPEKALSVYNLIQYQHDFAEDKRLSIDNFIRKVNDNIANHTQTSTIGLDTMSGEVITRYTTVVDELDYRDALIEMFIAEFAIFRNRGFNLTTRGKVEFQKDFPQLEYNYTDKNIYSLDFVNKCKYIYLLPVLKDMFLIPKFKSHFVFTDYSPRSPLIDNKYKRYAATNNAYLVYEWKCTRKTSLTCGLQATGFNDFDNGDENFFHGNGTVQLMIQDRYSGLGVILTTGFIKYNYIYYNAQQAEHNPMNNPHRVTEDLSSYDIFLKVHCGF